MAKIRKRGNSYQIDYVDPTGKRVRKSFSKKKDAEAELGKRVSLIAENRYLDVKKAYKTMTLRYAHLSQEHKKKAVNLLNGLTAHKTPTKSSMSQNVTNLDFENPANRLSS